MGYSARYHAASLAAVFLALAIGILVGVGFGSDVLTGTAESLEQSLSSDLDDAREQVADLEDQVDTEQRFNRLAYPALVDDRLRGREVALVAFGDIDDQMTADVRGALQASGATLREVAVVNEPPDPDAVIDALGGDRAPALSRDDALTLAGERAGGLLVRGGTRFDALRSSLLGRYSGAPGDVDGVVVVRARPDDMSQREAEDADRLEEAMIAGMQLAYARRTEGGQPPRVAVVGVERSDDPESSIEFFNARRVASVDNINQLPGKVSLVYVLGGAEGSYGVKETADGLLPDLLEPSDLAFGAPRQG
ncbi:MAG: hypothetical protein GEU88_00550 [Solirubrobacterales bacterium]|nr:hypothetical protein [Solirubrobacterales bacterium]